MRDNPKPQLVTREQYARVVKVDNATIDPRAWRRQLAKATQAEDTRKRRKARARLLRLMARKGARP